MKEGSSIDRAAAAIRAGLLVVFPTETVYGLGAAALDDAAVRSIFAAKARPADNPLIVHLAERGGLESVVASVSGESNRLLEAFAPGPLTLVLPAHPRVPRSVTAGLPTVAVRFPRHPVARALLERAGRPIAAPSANRSGEPSPTTVDMARRSLGEAVEHYLDGGPCEVGLESTVVRVEPGVATILRPGAVTIDAIRDVLPEVRVSFAAGSAGESQGAAPASPGMRHAHYRPRAAVFLARSPEAQLAARVSEPLGLIGLRDDVERAARQTDHVGRVVLRAADSVEELARSLYRWFAELDEAGVATIVAYPPSTIGLGAAIVDRLERASGGRWIS